MPLTNIWCKTCGHNEGVHAAESCAGVNMLGWTKDTPPNRIEEPCSCTTLDPIDENKVGRR